MDNKPVPATSAAFLTVLVKPPTDGPATTQRTVTEPKNAHTPNLDNRLLELRITSPGSKPQTPEHRAWGYSEAGLRHR